MEIYQLRSFLRVAEEGNVTRAAEALCLSQPAVTRHILALEKEVSVPLFDRTSKGVILTAAGSILLRHAQQVVSILDDCRKELSDARMGTSGRVVLAVGARHCISEWLPAFRERCPGISLTIYTRGTSDILELILDREVDMGLVVHPVDHPELEAIDLYTENVVLVIPPEHPSASNTVRFLELAETPVVLWTRGSDFRNYVENAFAGGATSMHVKVELDSVEEIKRLVMAGVGMTFLPESTVRKEVNEGILACARVDDLPLLSRETCAVYRKDRYLSTGARRLLELLLEWYG